MIGDSKNLKRIGDNRLRLDGALRQEPVAGAQVSPAPEEEDDLWGLFDRVILPTLGTGTEVPPLNTDPVNPDVLLADW